MIKLLKTNRISDGIVRMIFVAGERALQEANKEGQILHTLCKSWGIHQDMVVPTALRFFTDFKKMSTLAKKQDQQILQLQISNLINRIDCKNAYVISEQPDPTLYFSFLNQYASILKVCFFCFFEFFEGKRKRNCIYWREIYDWNSS